MCCNCSLIIKLYRHCMRFLCSWYPLLTSHWHICFSLMEILYLDLNASVLQVEMFIFRFSAFAFLIKTYTSELYMSLCSRCYHNFNKPHMLEGYYKYHKLHIHLPHFSKGFQWCRASPQPIRIYLWQDWITVSCTLYMHLTCAPESCCSFLLASSVFLGLPSY